jgi:hypothetical protein
MKGHRHVTVTNYDLNRQLFTRHGMHLNKTRKEIIAKHIAETCMIIFQTKQNSVPICMFWKETENCKVNLETDKGPGMSDSLKTTTEQRNETLCKSNRPKKPSVTKNNNFLW